MDSCRKSKIIEGAYYRLALPTLIALCSVGLRKPVLGSMAVLGEISISGIVQKVEELARCSETDSEQIEEMDTGRYHHSLRLFIFPLSFLSSYQEQIRIFLKADNPFPFFHKLIEE
nr:hypothetical protein [uncultured Acetatifactor sp.]